MPRPRDLPGALPDVFRVAEGRAAGVHDERLRRHDLERRVWGVRGKVGTADDFRGRCRLYAARLPEGAYFSHSTAARLLGIPLPGALERMTLVHVTVAPPRRAPHAEGLLGHRRVTYAGDVEVWRGLRISSAARVVLEMAPLLSLADLVASIDFLTSPRLALLTPARLSERISIGDRLSRHRNIRPALELSDPRAESRPESIVRVALALAGLTPDVNLAVRTSGGHSYRLDLAYPRFRVAVEYHGDYHRAVDQWRRDLTRRSRLEADGWIVVEVTAEDLPHPAEIVARVASALQRARDR